MNEDRLQQLLVFLEKFPNDAFNLYSIAYEYMRRAEWETAQSYFLRLRQQHPDYVGLYYHLGKILEHLEQVEAAFEAYEAGIEVATQQQDTHALSELQRAWQQLKEEEEWL